MRTYMKLSLTALVTAFVLASAIGTASAGRLSISNQSLRVAWARLSFGSGITSISCPVTLEGTFHYRSIIKAARSLIGYITRGAVGHGSCRTSVGTAAEAWIWNGVERILNEITTTNTLPWHLTYEGFGGNLPNINRLNLLLRGIKITISAPLAGCLATYGSPTANVIGEATVSSGTITDLRPEPNASLPLTESAGPERCPNPGTLSGTGTVTQLESATRLTVTLI